MNKPKSVKGIIKGSAWPKTDCLTGKIYAQVESRIWDQINIPVFQIREQVEQQLEEQTKEPEP